MDTEARIARIGEMEATFDAAADALNTFEAQLTAFEEAQPILCTLAAYYGSVEWFEDRDADEAGELPADLKRGVLGEDLPYNLLLDYHDVAVRMLELATRALKD